MENNIRKTIGITLIIAGAIILLSSLGILNLKFFAILDANLDIGDRGCYQEFVNIPTICGGLNTGKIYEEENKPQIYDGNWDTNIMAGSTEIYSTYINYTKPAGALSSSLWQVKDNYRMINLSIQSCGDNPNTIAFKIIQDKRDGNRISYQCYNVNWITLRETPPGYVAVYEEAMIWDINKTIPTIAPPICTSGQEKCEGATSFACKNNEWINGGKVIGKCGYSGSAITPEPEPIPYRPIEPPEPKKPLNFVFVITGSILMIGGIFMVMKNGR